MAKLPEEGYVVSIGTEGYWVSDGFAELLIQLLQYGDTSNVILTTKTAIQDEKMKLLSDIHSLSIEKEKLKEELEFVRGDNTKFEEDLKQVANEKRRLEAELEATRNELMEMTVKKNSLWNERFKLIQRANYWKNGYDTLSVDLEESQRNNIELAADVKALEVRFDIVSAASIGFRKDIQKLQEENIRLVKEREELQKQNEYLSGLNKDICEIHMKEKAELKKQLEASSDLTMASELANIFAEYTVADKKNRDDLGDKITEFRRKYGLE